MKIMIMALAALICQSMLASAVPDSVITGPYNVTFDLGIPKDAYKVEIKEPKTKESLSGGIRTEYQVDLINKTGIARGVNIMLTSYENEQVIPTQDESVKLLNYSASQIDGIYGVDAAKSMIDGQNSAIASGKISLGAGIGIDIDIYLAIYYPTLTTQVIVSSSYPWEEGSLSMFKTIHVEENNSTSLVGSI